MPSQPNNGLTNSRRTFLRQAGAASAGMWLAGRAASKSAVAAPAKTEALAINGGAKAVTHSDSGISRWPLYGDAEIEAVTKLLKSPNYAPVAQLEEAWKAYFGCPYAKAHCNGTSALTSMWFALNLPPGSEVLVPDYSTWFPVVPMRFFDLVPVFVDVNPKTMNICVEDCKRHLTGKTKAIMPVHWFGLPCDMDHICDFAKEHGLVVAEDASHSHGAKLKGKYMGNWGRIAGISMQMSKPLPSIEGGMAMYKERGDYERATTYGNYDLPSSFPADSPYRKYQGTALGSKLRIHPASAIVAMLQLKALKDHNATSVSQIQRLNKRITELPGLEQQFVRPEMERVFYNANLMFIDEKKAGASRSALVKALQAEGVGCTEFGWSLLHDYPMFGEKQWWRHMPVLPKAVPGCDEANRTAIRLPVFTTEQPEIVEQYGKAFEKVWTHRKELA